MLRCMKFLCFLPTETTQASTPGLCSCLLPPSTSDCEHEQQSSYSFSEDLSQSHRLNGPASDFRYVTLASTALKVDKPSCVLVLDLESPSNHVPQTFPQMPTSVSWHLFPLKSIFMAGQRLLPPLSFPDNSHAFLFFLCNIYRNPSFMPPSTPRTLSSA